MTMCKRCGKALLQTGRGRKRVWCSERCRRAGRSRSDAEREASRAITRRYRAAHPARVAEQKRRYRQANPRKYGEEDWRYYLKRLYKLSGPAYDRLLTAQGGVCAGCLEAPTKRRLSVDHNHACCDGTKSCGRCIRGLLCVRCNMAAELVEQSGWAERMAAYLANPPAANLVDDSPPSVFDSNKEGVST